jgi:hypothetical protein
MGTQYTDDGGLGDFIVGKATGAGYNFHSNLGAQLRQPSTQPVSYTPPKTEGAGTSNVLGVSNVQVIAKPVRQQTPEEILEMARRKANRSAITKRASYKQRLSGHVVSYLDVDGNLIVNGEGDLDTGQIVQSKEHLRRLKKAYRTYWEGRLEYSKDWKRSHTPAYRIYRDASERLQLLKKGRFLAPVC